tara:strand:+ start:3458 stop:3820 length:363 start_codon:yes stop_codon:yes gene_type:complete
MKMSTIHIFRGPEQTSICTVDEVKRTETMFERMRGLLGSAVLTPNTGLWISSCNSIHSFFMGFSIDVLYLDKNNTILRVIEDMPPWSINACWPARSVIELRQGQVAVLGIQPGDSVQCIL